MAPVQMILVPFCILELFYSGGTFEQNDGIVPGESLATTSDNTNGFLWCGKDTGIGKVAS
jgi:hypothetical protein